MCANILSVSAPTFGVLGDSFRPWELTDMTRGIIEGVPNHGKAWISVDEGIIVFKICGLGDSMVHLE